jgi:hypothetical protein
MFVRRRFLPSKLRVPLSALKRGGEETLVGVGTRVRGRPGQGRVLGGRRDRIVAFYGSEGGKRGQRVGLGEGRGVGIGRGMEREESGLMAGPRMASMS